MQYLQRYELVNRMCAPSQCRNGAVRYDPVMKLREALDTLNRVKGLTHAEQGECGVKDSAEKER